MQVIAYNPKINNQDYLTVSMEVVSPWIDCMAAGCQQDGPPAHNSKGTQEWCQVNLPEQRLLAFCSPNSYLLDNFLWCFLKNKISRNPHNFAEFLKVEITRSMASHPRHPMVKACRWLMARLKTFVNTNSNFIEGKHNKHVKTHYI